MAERITVGSAGSAVSVPRPQFNVGENQVGVLGAYTPRTSTSIRALAGETVRRAVGEAVASAGADLPDRASVPSPDRKTQTRKSPGRRRGNKSSSPSSPPSAARLRARAFGKRRKQRDAWAKRNALEVEAFKRDLARKDAEEQERRGAEKTAQSARRTNPYAAYFGFDVRKSYP